MRNLLIENFENFSNHSNQSQISARSNSTSFLAFAVNSLAIGLIL